MVLILLLMLQVQSKASKEIRTKNISYLLWLADQLKRMEVGRNKILIYMELTTMKIKEIMMELLG